jgi:hypothetical protein
MARCRRALAIKLRLRILRWLIKSLPLDSEAGPFIGEAFRLQKKELLHLQGKLR